MSKRFTLINFSIVIIFLLTTIFPSGAFSYQFSPRDSGRIDKKVDESHGQGIETFKKARCPNCGMEFFYIPGKDSPHSHWVQYEIPEDRDTPDSDSNAVKKEDEAPKAEEKGLLGLFTKKKEAQEKIAQNPSEKDTLSLPSERFQIKRYELRQKLTCPYDGYSFFPEGDVIENRKLMKASLMLEEASIIESSFSQSIPFGISKELKQFGYDLFMVPEEEKEKKDAAIKGEAQDAFSALGMLKAVFTPASSTPAFSTSPSVGQTAVIPIGPDYVIGPGDTLIINIWGSVQESFPVEVDREGRIMLPKAGPVYLWGMKFQEAENRIREKLNEFYTNFNVDVSMGKIRDIQIYAMGEVKKPGSYAINSQSTIFQALYAAGGPAKLGSLRKIKIIHADRKVELVDLYPFLLQGDNIEYSRIQSGDTIFVPPIGDVVAIAGNVKRPAIYEAKSEILLSDLLDFAGGIAPTGNLQRLQVERIKDNERRVVVDVDLKASSKGEVLYKDISMRNGDLVMVAPIVRLRHNFVSILGNVENPGDYGLTQDMAVRDLIERAKGFMPGTYLYRAEIARVTKDRSREIMPINLDKMMLGASDENIALKEWDILLVYSEAEASAPSYVEIDGSVNKPGKYELTPDMKISDLIFRSGGVKPQDFIRGAELFHIIPGEQPIVIGIGIKRISGANIAIDKDILLQPGDMLFVKSEPKLTEKRLATIKGEVRFPGAYPIMEGERLSDLIERAGGYTKDAFLEGPIFNRKSIKEIQEKVRQKFIERENKAMLEEQQAILLRGGGSITVSEPLKSRKEMLDFISSAEIEGRMVIKLMSIHQLKNTKYDVLLEDGDSLTIPQAPSAVLVIGSVNNSAAVPFEEGKGIDYYIQRTGGITKHADKTGIYVIRANGEAINKFMMAKYVERGDTIVVPQEFKYWIPPGQLLKDTVEMLSRIAVGVGIIAALQ